MNKDKVLKDFQSWALKNNYSWSGAADVWIAAHDYYSDENKDLKEIAKKYAELVLVNQGMKEQIANMRHLIEFIEGKGL